MTPWIVLAVYVVGWFATLRILKAHAEDWTEGEAGLEIIGAFMWPLIAAVFAACGTLLGLRHIATSPIPKPRNPFRRKVKDGDPQRIAELEEDA